MQKTITKSSKSMPVCKKCVNNCFSLDDKNKYTCTYCAKESGHRKFNTSNLNKYIIPKFSNHIQACNICSERLKNLRKRVHKSTIKCFCRKTHAEGLHKDTCLVDFNHNKWPGSDEGVSAKDYKFLTRIPDQHKPHWWTDPCGQPRATKLNLPFSAENRSR